MKQIVFLRFTRLHDVRQAFALPGAEAAGDLGHVAVGSRHERSRHLLHHSNRVLWSVGVPRACSGGELPIGKDPSGTQSASRSCHGADPVFSNIHIEIRAKHGRAG